MLANAPTIKNHKALKKHMTHTKYFHSIGNILNPTQASDSIPSVIQEE